MLIELYTHDYKTGVYSVLSDACDKGWHEPHRKGSWVVHPCEWNSLSWHNVSVFTPLRHLEWNSPEGGRTLGHAGDGISWSTEVYKAVTRSIRTLVEMDDRMISKDVPDIEVSVEDTHARMRTRLRTSTMHADTRTADCVSPLAHHPSSAPLHHHHHHRKCCSHTLM